MYFSFVCIVACLCFSEFQTLKLYYNGNKENIPENRSLGQWVLCSYPVPEASRWQQNSGWSSLLLGKVKCLVLQQLTLTLIPADVSLGTSSKRIRCIRKRVAVIPTALIYPKRKLERRRSDF